MKRVVPIAIGAVLYIFVMTIATTASAQNANVDQNASDSVTKYLHKHRLPMVGAQITNGASGRQMMLYGFVATNFGKQDAETKARQSLHDPTIPIVNSIRVNPQLHHLKKHDAASEDDQASGVPNSPNAMPPAADWEHTVDDTLRAGGATPSNDPTLNMPPPGGPAPVPPGATW
jgi:hypothetical protein